MRQFRCIRLKAVVGFYVLPSPLSAQTKSPGQPGVNTLEEATATVSETLLSIWTAFVAHVPYLVGGTLILLFTWLLTRLVGGLGTV